MKTLLSTSFLLLLVATAGCAASPEGLEPDELAAEDADLGALGAADAAGGLYTYYSVRQDVRRCVFPLCGGYWVSRVQRASTRCADGRWASECYVAEIDFGALGLSDDERATLDGEVRSGRAILRGEIGTGAIGDFEIARLDASEAWVAPADFVADGVYVLVEDSGIRCITSPCYSMTERKLNSSIDSTIAALDLTASGATEEQIAAASESLASHGLIVAGYRTTVRGPAGRGRGREATAFWTRFVGRGGAADGCVVTGCSGQICGESDVVTTCEWRESYACYRTATCERQADGRCGWTETPELDACLAGSI